MKAPKNLLIRLLYLVCIGSGFAYAADNGSGEIGTHLYAEKTLHSKTGMTWHYRVDDVNRLVSFRREGSSSGGFEYLYEGDSRKPAAARLVGHKWQLRNMSQVNDDSGCVNNRNSNPKTISAVLKLPIRNSQILLRPQQNLGDRFFIKTFVPGEGDVVTESINAFNDLELFYDGLYGQQDIEWQALLWALRTPEERQKCVDFCNDVTDAAWLSCGSIALLGFEAAPIATACAAYFWYKRDQCRSGCSK